MSVFKNIQTAFAIFKYQYTQHYWLQRRGVVAYRLASFTALHIEKLVTIGSRWHYKNALATKPILQSNTAESWKSKFPATFNLYRQINPEPDFNKLAQSLVNMWLNVGSSGYANNHIEKSALALLIIRGDKDPLCSLADVTELAAIVKGSGMLNIPFTGHAAFINEPEIVTICLKRFFNHVN